MRLRRTAAAWGDADGQRITYGPVAAAVGLTATGVAVVLPALFVVGDDFKELVAVVLAPVFGVLGFVVAPAAGAMGLALWRRGWRSGERGWVMNSALLLNIVGFSWWVYVAAAGASNLVA